MTEIRQPEKLINLLLDEYVHGDLGRIGQLLRELEVSIEYVRAEGTCKWKRVEGDNE
jgi:hypothetical protein